jgi:hypothetical protein
MRSNAQITSWHSAIREPKQRGVRTNWVAKNDDFQSSWSEGQVVRLVDILVLGALYHEGEWTDKEPCNPPQQAWRSIIAPHQSLD